MRPRGDHEAAVHAQELMPALAAGGRRDIVAADADKCPVLGRILGNVVGGVGPPLGYPDQAGF